MATYKPIEMEGFKCPKCGRTCLTQCIDSRFFTYGKRRRRQCEFCGERFNTIEIIGDARIAQKITEMN